MAAYLKKRSKKLKMKTSIFLKRLRWVSREFKYYMNDELSLLSFLEEVIHRYSTCDKEYITGTVPVNKEHLTDTVPVNKKHHTCTLNK